MLKVKDRRGTLSVKYDSLLEHFGVDNVTPLWVADMDFESPLCVREALEKIVSGAVYGYNIIPPKFFETIQEWVRDVQGWKIEKEWCSFIPGIVKGIGYVINHFTKPGGGIIIQPPVYPPFTNVPKGNGRNVLYNPLIRVEDGGYRMDFDNLEAVASRDDAKLMILCNPHNPCGIAWDRASLAKVADICLRHNVLVVSDEIHADMPLSGTVHIPFATVSEAAAMNSITFGAPSKTFNMAGIVSSFSIVPNDKIREEFYTWMDVNELNSPTIFATGATIAAYTKGLEWRGEMLEYIEDNVNFTMDYFKRNIPLIKPVRPMSSFLVWLDCRELCKAIGGATPDAATQRRLVNLFLNDAGLALNDGSAFGPGGFGYMRLNVGCSLELLAESYERLRVAVGKNINNLLK